MIQLILYGFCFILYLGIYLRQRRRTFEQFKGMGHLPVYPLIGSAPSMYRKDGRDFYKKLNKMFKKYGENFYFSIENNDYVVFSNKDDIKAILTNKKLTGRQNEYKYFKPWLGESVFTTSHVTWKTKRKEFYSYFNSKTVENSICVFEHHADNFTKALKYHSEIEQDFDVYTSVESFAMDVICEIALGVQNNSHVKVTKIQHNIEEIVKIIMWRVTHPLYRNDFFYKFTQKYRDSEEMSKYCRTFIQGVIDRTKLKTRESLTLKDAKSFVDYMCCINERHTPISDEEMQSELLSTMFAGLDTMTSSISFLLYNLGKYPEIQEKVYDEIESNIDFDCNLTVQCLNSLKYTDSVIRESLRLFPAAPIVARVTPEDITLNGKSYPAGTSFGVSIYNAHRNPKNFANPEEFIPERHNEVRSIENNNSYNFIPFAPGVRACKGNKIAEYEMKTLLVKMLKLYKIQLKDDYEPDISWDVVLKPYNGVWIKLKPRISNPDDIEAILTSSKVLEKSNDYYMFESWLGGGLLISHGPKWHSRRKILTHAFHFKILDDFVRVFDLKADVLVKQINKHLNGPAFDVCPYVTLYTLDVICETAMGIKMDVQTNSDSEYVRNVVEISSILYWRLFNVFARESWIFRWMPQAKRHDYLVDRIQQFTMKVIDTRRKEFESKTEINQNTIANPDDEDADIGVKKRYALLDLLLAAKQDGQPLTDDDIREEVNNFMFAGHDTTTSAIEFLLYNLAKYPDVQKKVFEEIVEVMGTDTDEPITLHKLNNLHYLDLVLKESLRLYAPVPMINRQVREDVELNGKLYPAGITIVVFIDGMHHDPKYFKDPEMFIPERHAAIKNADTKNPFSYVPFAAGFRNCIGQKFAQYEIKSVISKLLRHYEFSLGSDDFIPVLKPELILKPGNGINLKIKPRVY
uniref:CSON004758 protein n=1 Tax=Culicoides sonorensis TaxID=179676 RepID=A0A336MRC1_CULSO